MTERQEVKANLHPTYTREDILKQLEKCTVFELIQYKYITADLQSDAPRGRIIDPGAGLYERYDDGYQYTFPTNEELAALIAKKDSAENDLRNMFGLPPDLPVDIFRSTLMYGENSVAFLNRNHGYSVRDILLALRTLSGLIGEKYIIPVYPYSKDAPYEEIGTETDIDAIVVGYCMRDLERIAHWNETGLMYYPPSSTNPEPWSTKSVVKDYGISTESDLPHVQAFWARVYSLYNGSFEDK